MLGKPLSHLRPLLRLPTHAQPDHFTSNPSLLHHFPQQAGHAVVQAGPSQAQAAGQGAGGAGRAGWGGGSAGGSGYTGHARAFLGLPQTSSVDPTSGLTTDESKEQERLRLKQQQQRRYEASNLTRNQAARREAVAVNDAIREARSARRLQSVMLEEAEQPEELETAARLAASLPGPKRRESIAYPRSVAQSQGQAESGMEASTSRSPRQSPRPSMTGLGRSTSSLDLLTQRPVHPQLRAYSTRLTPVPLPDVDAHIARPTSSRSRLIPQPNRVLTDLAGRDLPPRSSLARRFNATLATAAETPRSWDDMPLPPASSGPSSVDEDRSQQIYAGIIGRTARCSAEPKRSELISLIAHYRSPRQLAALDDRQQPGDPSWTKRYPLPQHYNTAVYNACLEGLMALRSSGESIAKILEAYNEMLERDVLPNMRTYSAVIRALCARETDVWLAVQRWTKEKAWAQWRAESAGEVYEPDSSTIKRDQLIEGYIAEGNLSSALRLFSAARTFQVTSKWKFQPGVYSTILKTIATMPQPNLTAMRQVFEHARNRQQIGTLGLYRFVFEALGRAGLTDETEKLWTEFRDKEQSDRADELFVWVDQANDEVVTEEGNAARVRGARHATYRVAIRTFARLGNMQRAQEIVGMIERGKEEVPDFDSTSNAYAALILGVADRDIEAAIKLYHDLQPKLADSSLGRLPITELNEFVDALVFAGKWQFALEILRPNPDTRIEPDIYRARHLHQAILVSANNASAEVAKGMLDQFADLIRDRRFPLTAFASKRHLAVLRKHGLWADTAPFLQLFEPSREKLTNFAWMNTYVEDASPHLSLIQLIRLMRAIKNCSIDLIAETTSGLLAERYVSDRTADPATFDKMRSQLTGHDWSFLFSRFARLDGRRFSEGEYDEALERFTQDFVRAHTYSDHLQRLVPSQLEAFAEILEHRFGRERTQILLDGVPVPGWTKGAEDKVDAAVPTDMESAASSVPTDFTIPSSPASTAPTSTGTTGASRIRIDRNLSGVVDRHLARNSRISPQTAYNTVVEQLHKGIAPYPGAFGRLINSLGRAGGPHAETNINFLYNTVQSMLPELQGQRQAADWLEVETGMLIAQCHLGHLERAGVFRQRIIDAGLAPSADAYATMIASSKDTTDDVLVARALFDESQALGVVPNLYLYNTIISKLSRARKAEIALELFGHMKAAGIAPSSVTYGAVINACCRVGDAQSAETLFEEMRNAPGFKPRVPPYNTLMQYFVQNMPSREKALHYYGLLREAGVPPSAHTYKLLLDAYGTLAPIDLVSVERVYGEMVADREVSPQPTHLASLITAYGMYGNDMAKALEVFESNHGQSADSAKDAVTWEAILNVVAHNGTLADLEAMRQRLEASGVRPTAYVYNVLITGYARSGQVDKARQVFESMGDSVSGVAAPNNHPILHTSSGYAKPQTATDMPTNTVYREPSTYEAIIRAELDAGETQRAQELLGRMEARGYPFAVYMKVKAIVEGQTTTASLGDQSVFTAPSAFETVDLAYSSTNQNTTGASAPSEQEQQQQQ